MANKNIENATVNTAATKTAGKGKKTSRPVHKTTEASVTNLVDAAFVPGETRDFWQVDEICRIKTVDNRTLRQKNADKHKKMEEGLNKVMLLAATYRSKGNREMFVLELRNVGKNEAHAWAEEKFISLFPGDSFTDRKGMFHEAGWNWDIFSNEIARQIPELKGLGVEEQLVKLAGKAFNVYLFKNKVSGYTELYMTADAYNNRVDKLAKKTAIASANADEAPFDV